MDEASTLMLKRYFREYYFRFSGRIQSPPEIEKREFGYIPFGGTGGMVRHLSFGDIGQLRALLVKEAPAGVYCSNSLYRNPTLDMHLKEWIRAELIFDIDADALKLPCKKVHDIWLCRQCEKKEFGLRPETCPACNGNRILSLSWACRNCIEGTRKETYKLLDFLESDFGISDSQIRVYFSGNAGFHIEVVGSALESLDQHERAEISDYLTSTGISYEIFKSQKLSPSDPGWRGKIARYIRDIPTDTPPFKSNTFETRLRELVTDFSKTEVEEFLNRAISQNAVRIDAMVTTDIHRIFRMPETLNNKTGLIKKACSDLSSFDPLVEAVALKDLEKTQVTIDMCPKIELNGVTFGPYRQETKELPMYAAVYLVSKGAAKFYGKSIQEEAEVGRAETEKAAATGGGNRVI